MTVFNKCYVDNKEVTVKTKIISQGKITSDCWTVQIWGKEACTACEFKGTHDCGGETILELIDAGKFPEKGLPDERV